MVVLNKDSEKLINYQQLRQDPKHKKVWNKSAMNKFGWLIDGVGGRVKGTQAINLSTKVR